MMPCYCHGEDLVPYCPQHTKGDDDMMTATDKVTLKIVAGPEYAVDAEGWAHNAYTLKLHYQGRTMTTPWMQGTGITGDPDPASVLESLFLDAASFDNSRDFEDWASEYGYDTDSRKAEKLYGRVSAATINLAALFGVTDHDTTASTSNYLREHSIAHTQSGARFGGRCPD